MSSDLWGCCGDVVGMLWGCCGDVLGISLSKNHDMPNIVGKKQRHA
jgi:hypothetical protein